MLKSFFTLALRHLWRNRLYTLLNVVGLAIGLSACWVIYRLVSYEFAFDRHHPDRDRIYRIVTRFREEGSSTGNAGTPLPMLGAVRSQVPGVESVVPVRTQWSPAVDAGRPSGKPVRYRDIDNVVATTTAYFKLVPQRWLAGDPVQALGQPRQVVLSRSRAERYFPGLTPRQVLGRSLTYFDTLNARVTGVVDDPLEPSSFGARELLSLASFPPTPNEASLWDNINSADQLFIRLVPNVSAGQVEQRINDLTALHSESVKLKNGVRDRWHPLQPLATLHFDTDYGDSNRRASRTVLFGLIGLAGFILAMAGINYVNLATALMPTRSREIGVRKTLGSRRWSLVGQFVGESLATVLLALGVAWLLSQAFFAHFSDLLPPGSTSYVNWPLTTGFLTVMVVVVSLLSGFYPGWLATRLQPVVILRGQFAGMDGRSPGGLTLRRGLIVFQFVIAQVFIISAVLLGQQLHFALNKDMGFNRDAVVLATFPQTNADKKEKEQQRQRIRDQVARLPGVAAVSLGNPPANQSFSRSEYTLKKAKRTVNVVLQLKFVDSNYVGLYKLPLLAGRNLRSTDSSAGYVINETASRALGFRYPREAIGQVLQSGDQSYAIVGVVRDFQVSSVRDPITPVALAPYQAYANQVSIRMASSQPADWSATLAQVQAVWATFFPDEPFNYEFYDQTLARFYEREQTTGRIINLATGLAILISCLGLFGLATLTALQRTKEIGIRKVLGADIAGIVALLSRDFLRLVVVAILIASPLAYYVIHRWLQDFAYKITISGWVFVSTGLLAIGIALLTVSFQSIRAALVNPVQSLRRE